jgi:pimeloyl-ACP methyl ester carboxylesterase
MRSAAGTARAEGLVETRTVHLEAISAMDDNKHYHPRGSAPHPTPCIQGLKRWAPTVEIGLSGCDDALRGCPMKVGHIDGVDVVVDGDSGRVILMVHGWPDTRVLWDDQVTALRDRFRCVRFTLPGFEPGSLRRAASLQETLTLFDKVLDLVSPEQPVILLLHDWGCFFGYQYAMLRPDRVERVIGMDIGDAGSPAHAASLALRARQ